MSVRRASLQHITLLAFLKVSMSVTSFVDYVRMHPLPGDALKKDKDRKKTGSARITPTTGKKVTPIANRKSPSSKKAMPQAISKSLSSRQSFLSIFQNPLRESLSILISYWISIYYLEVKTSSPLNVFFS